MTPQEQREAQPLVELELAPDLDVVFIKLRGEHDLVTQARIRDALIQATEHAPRVLVDLSECTFADSSLVKVLSDTRERFDDRGVILEAVIPHEARAVRRLAEMTRLAEIVPIYESRNAAIHQRAQRA